MTLGSACRAALALAVAFGTAACGREPAQQDTLSAIRATLPKNPCTILRKADIEASAGTSFADGVDNRETGTPPPVPIVGIRFCLYKSAEPGGPIVQLGVAGRFAEEVFNKLKTDQGLQPLTPVDGLGQEALFKDAGPLGWIAVLNADQVLAVHVSFVERDLRGVAEDLALKTLGG